MTHQVEVNGEIHEFPDDTTPEMMQKALSKEIGRQKLKEIINNGIFDRPRERLSEDAWSFAKNVGNSVSSGAPSLLNQLQSDPIRAGKNVIAGAAGIPMNIANAFMNLPAYLTHLESNKLSNKIKEYTPQIPKESYQKGFVGGEDTQEDKDIRNLTELLPISFPIGKTAASAGIGVAKAGGNRLLGKTDPLLEAKQLQLELAAKGKQEEVNQATETHNLSEATHKEALGQSKREIGKSDADLMQFNAEKRQKDVENLSNETAQLQQELNATKPAEEAAPQAEQNLLHSQEVQKNSENILHDINNNIGQHLNEGAAHSVRIASGIDNRVQSIEKYWGDSYKKFENNIRESKFEMPQSAMSKLDYSKLSPTQLIRTFGADAFDAIKKGKVEDFIKQQITKERHDEANPYFDNLMEVAPTIVDTSAADFLAKFKDFRDRSYKLGQKLRDPRVEEVEKQKIESALKSAREMQVQMKQVLDEGLGEYKPEFERINKGYAEQVFPLRDNPVVKAAKEGRLTDDVMKSLRTNEPGMPLLRDIVKQDPELLRNIVGQKYFSKPNAIHNPNEMTLEYLNEMPELKQMLNEYRQASNTLEQAKNNTKLAEEKHAEVQAQNKKSAKIEKDINDLTEQVNKYKDEIQKIEKNIDRIRQAAEKKNISLEQKIKSEKELKDLKKQLSETKRKLSDSTTGLRKAWLVAKTIYHVGKKII